MINKNKMLKLFLCGIALHGCEHLEREVKQPSTQEALSSQQRLQQLKQWKISAKVTVERHGQHYSTAYLNWQQNGENYDINITSPFGDSHLQINKDGKAITATSTVADAPVKKYNIKNIDDFANKLSGLKLPVEQLQYWIKGTPDPRQEYFQPEYDANNNLISIIQDDWYIQWNRFDPNQKPQLPHKIKATQEKNGSLKVTVIIAEWKK